ncbi:MAG: nucleoside phosphorylase [Bacillota bacterium]|nr:nucleoside phosphorylase [Bacillota bacterium]MDW7676329.1 nucleoside phosphorylase [Bacillota bacterium]
MAPYVLLPGDPGRVLRIAAHLQEWREIAFNREFRTITGLYQGIPVTVTSTGIGGASTVIAVEELIACGAETLIRIGSAGAIQPEIGVGDMIIVQGAVREDGASRMYVPEGYPAVPDPLLTVWMEQICQAEGYPFHSGLIRSHDSFYIDEETAIMDRWNRRGVLGSDMETAALFVTARLRGAKAASILNNVVLYQAGIKEGIADYVNDADEAVEGEKREIRVALETLKKLSDSR